MKIIITGTAYPYRGGLAAFNERLAAEFVREGHDVEIYTFTLQYPKFLFPGKTQYSDDPAPKDLKIVRRINSVNPFNWLKTGKEISAKNPDLVIFCYWMSFMSPCFGTIAKIVGKNHRVKRIGLIHNMLPHEPNILDKFLPKYFVKHIDSFVTLSKSVINDINLFDRNNKPKIYSPHPIYDHYGEPMSKQIARKFLNISEDDRLVLFFGFIRQYKGLDLLLDAFGNEQIRTAKLKLLVAGEFYDAPEPYYQKIKDLHIENQVLLHTDYIPENKVKYYFCAADIVAQPYRTATQSGVSQIAYHFEKPILVTNVGGLPEIVPDGTVGYVVDTQPNEIAEALVDFFEKKREKTFVENIKTEKEKYGWDKFVKVITN
ncbi:glycosyl transferase [Bacteroidia bacterium]|nr:glycosyl transferase [Bacteroidia bacterium]